MDSERKQTQAELDAIQFAKEQETKKIGEQQNKTKTQVQNQKIRNGLKELLKDAKIKNQAFDANLIDKLPSEICKHIATMTYTRGFKNGYQLIPAITPASVWIHQKGKICETRVGYIEPRYKFNFKMKIGPQAGKHNLFEIISDCWMESVDPNTGYIKGRRSCRTKETLALSTFDVRKLPHKSLHNLSEISGKFINGTLFLDRCEMRTLLEQCTTEQIEFIRSLWKKYKYMQYAHFGAVYLFNEEQVRIFKSLPEKIRYNLVCQYDIKTEQDVCRENYGSALIAAGIAIVAATLLYTNQ